MSCIDVDNSGKIIHWLEFCLINNYRYGRWTMRIKWRWLRNLLRHPYYASKCILFVLTGANLRSGASIGERLRIPSFSGLVVTDHVVIGDDCVIHSGVCIVSKGNNRGEGVPKIGNKVWIGEGAKILGNVSIGDRAVIAPNSVVIRDVAPQAIVEGVPSHRKPLTANIADRPGIQGAGYPESV